MMMVNLEILDSNLTFKTISQKKRILSGVRVSKYIKKKKTK